MSAYIVDETVMHRVIRGVVTALQGEGFIDANSMTDLARLLFMMNADAVRHRYPAHDDYKYGLELAASFTMRDRIIDPARTIAEMVDCYKAIDCLLYQCSEGDVPDSTHYKSLQAVQSRLANKIVGMLPEYQRAAW